jgi:hypothetical protein
MLSKVPIEPRGARAAHGHAAVLASVHCFCFRSLPEGFYFPRCILPMWTELSSLDGKLFCHPIGVALGWEGWFSIVPPAALLSRVALDKLRSAERNRLNRPVARGPDVTSMFLMGCWPVRSVETATSNIQHFLSG